MGLGRSIRRAIKWVVQLGLKWDFESAVQLGFELAVQLGLELVVQLGLKWGFESVVLLVRLWGNLQCRKECPHMFLE